MDRERYEIVERPATFEEMIQIHNRRNPGSQISIEVALKMDRKIRAMLRGEWDYEEK